MPTDRGARVGDTQTRIESLYRGRVSAMPAKYDPRAPIEKGTRVRVLAGPFEGKVGVVQGLDGESGARVMLGLLAMRFEAKDLIATAQGKDRPMLASSHRKPLPARS